MKLSIIICTSNRPESLKKVLQSLDRQVFKNFETLIMRESPLVKARDLGWRQAKGEVVAWIDDDVILDKDWAKNLVEIFEENKDVGGVSGPTIVPENLLINRLVFWWYGQKSLLAKLWVKLVLDNQPFKVGKITKIGWWSPGSNFKSCLKIEGLQEVDYLEACNMSLRRDLVKKAGGFDLNYKGTSEWCELDLAMRIKHLGYRLVWSREVKVEHQVSRSGVFIKRKNWPERIKNYLKFRKKWLLKRQ
ncbi:MAG: Glycosyl transferase family protein [Candidatus Beckwithbacteria bacterium GW2011_GWA2_43_10]|uniref:Glycosyl transferase family protein n=1 Tax=Candidatus Beckwithbacteria bacterium GW2011_GWA2_43_10 TaxID=1618369 RepID=A0A0G1C225_9BACT|nr:MAG: Glycosyl transferase family protein [Candidatus Beckwithbacteria bacterium GW2011_GWA2_43_10]